MSDIGASADGGQQTTADVAAITQDGIESWPCLDDPGTWLYVAGSLGPERGPTGAPTLALLELGASGILQCGASWEADPAALERLRQEAARRTGRRQVRLSPAVAEVRSAQLVLLGGDGGQTILQETTASNYPPYAAIFHVPLDGERRMRVEEALGGKVGILSIQYVVRVQRRVRATARVRGTVEPTAVTQDDDALGLATRAIAAGQIAVTESIEGPAPDELRASARKGALARAAATLRSALPADGAVSNPVSIDVTVSLAAVVSDETARSTDVALWWQGGQKPSLLGGAGAVPPSAERSGPPAGRMPVAGLLSVERGVRGAPVAFVETKGSSLTALLQGPDFAATSLAAPIGSTLRIAVHYTDGGPAYEAEVTWAGGAGCILGPAELGLARITLDASSRKAIGFQSLAAKVIYSPWGEGTVDVHEARFRYGEWKDEWLVVTRQQGLGGELTVEWRETAADGAVTVHPPEPRQGQNIAL